MNSVFVCTDHEGHWPVGVASVVVASTEDQARTLLAAELKSGGLTDSAFTLVKLDLDKPKAYVLCNGDY